MEIPTRRNFKAIPYVLGRTRDIVEGKQAVSTVDVGLDLKYSITPSLTFDATYNTDFAQVEVDEQQVNLDRFDLFFPEKRSFFLENAGNFEMGSPGEIELFFTRRIGIGAGGVAIPIHGGARLSGKTGTFKIGILDMQTQRVENISPANNFLVGRVDHGFAERSSVGALFVNRQATGSDSGSQNFNRTFAVDGRIAIGMFSQLSGYLSKTVTPGKENNDYAFRLGGSHNSKSWQIEFYFTEVAPNFNPEVGFVRRKGYRKPEVLLLHRYRPDNILCLLELRPHISYRGFWNFDGFQETGFLHLDNHFEWKNGFEIHTGLNFTREGVTKAFEIYPEILVLPGTYDHKETQIVFRTNEARAISFNTTINTGGFFGGSKFSATSTLRSRFSEQFNLQISLNRNDMHVPLGYFITNVLRVRASYYFSPRIFLQSLIQYNDRTESWSTNVRFGFLQTANTGMYIVFNENREVGGIPSIIHDRSFIVKYSYMFDLLD